MDLSLSYAELLLIGLWFSVALWNTSVGPTGGITFATMASVLPPNAAIPIQAMVEGISSVLRLWLLRIHIDWHFLRSFILGGILGFALGAVVRVVTNPSDDFLLVIMGVLILATSWLPLGAALANHSGFPWFIGMFSSLISLFSGGGAALIAASVDKKHDDHRITIATMTASLIFQHMVRVAIFGLFLGFSFGKYAVLMVLMTVAALIGTWVGKRFLINVPQRIIKPIFKALVTILGVQLILSGIMGLV